MNYLINFFITIIFVFFNQSFANENKIIFKINNKIFSELDFRYRINYLEQINGIKYSTNSEKDFKNDFFNSVMFFEYVTNNKRLNKILAKESKKIFDQIKNNFNLPNNLNDDFIVKNINYDFSKKIVLEDLLRNYTEYIFNEPNDINFIYNYKIQYITIPIDNLISKNIIAEINKLKNTEDLINFIEDRNIKYNIVSRDIKDLKKINNKIQKLINSSIKIHKEKNNDFFKITIFEKNLEFTQGVFYNLINFETDIKLSKDKENCHYIKSLIDIKSIKEYEFNKLNEKIKNNLKDINDFLIFQNNNKLNYIFLCQIRVNEDFLKEVNINKKINFLAKNIEIDFVNNYSKQYNAKKLY